MARRRGTQDLFTGRSGQLAVVAEVLIRLCNAAIPEVDIGADVFAFQDEREVVARLQVKTGQATRYKKEEGYSAQFSIPLNHLDRPNAPTLYFVFAVRLEGRFVDFLVIPRSRLRDYASGERRFGTEDNQGNLILTIQFRDRVRCGEVDLTSHRNAWDMLPPLQPLPPTLQSPPHT